MRGIYRERYVNRILRNVIAMERLAEARGVQLKNSRPGQLARILAIVLVSHSQQGILTRITNQHLATVGLQKIM
jgi:hypothetical protein